MKYDGWNLIIGGSITIVTVMYGTRELVHNYIIDSEPYKEALKCLRKNSEAVEILGEPIVKKKVYLPSRLCHFSNPGFQFMIPMKGSKSTGQLVYWVTSEPSATQDMYKAEIRFKDASIEPIVLKDRPPCIKTDE